MEIRAFAAENGFLALEVSSVRAIGLPVPNSLIAAGLREMVRTQFACGTGRRCASEIEITGRDANVAKTGWCSGRSSRPCRVVTKGTG